MYNILVTIPTSTEQKAKLKNACSDSEFEFIMQSDLKEVDVINRDFIIGNIPITYIKSANKLKWLQLNMSGYEGYPAAMPKGVPVTNTRGAFGLAISEHMIGMLLEIIKKLNLYRDNQNKSLWHDEGNVTSIENSTILTVGLGNIGGDFARKVSALGAYTIGIKRDISVKPDYINELYTLDSIDKLLPRCDVVALSVPNDESTYKIMNEKRIALLKKGAVILNVGRGAAIDTEALADAVERGDICCGLDVTDPEPLPADHRLWKMKNAVITPHISGFFHLPQTLDRIIDIACHNLECITNGRELINVVN